MIWIISIMVAISILLTTYFVFYHPQKDHKRSKQIRQWIFGMFFLVGLLLFPFVLSTASSNYPSWIGIVEMVMYLLILSFGLMSKEISLSNKWSYRCSLFVTKIIYLIIYVPLISIYVFKREPIEIIIRNTVLVTVVCGIIFIFYQKLMRSKWANIVRFINVFTIALLVIILFSFSDRLSTYIYKTISDTNVFENGYTMDVDINSELILSFEDNTLHTDENSSGYLELLDVEITNEGIYYVSRYDLKIILGHYSFAGEQATTIYEYELPVEDSYMFKKDLEMNTLQNVGDTIYYFTGDGIYTILNDVLTKVSDISAYESDSFEDFDSNWYIINILSNNVYEIYKLKENELELIEVWDYSQTSDQFIINTINMRLYTLDTYQNSLTVYRSNIFQLPVPFDNLQVRAITENDILVEDVSGENRDQLYISTTNGIVRTIPGYFNNWYQYHDFNNQFYIGESIIGDSIKSTYLYNIEWYRAEEIKLRLFNVEQKRDSDTFYKIEMSDLGRYYVAYRSDDESTYMELSKLYDLENTVEFEYFKYLDVFVIGVSGIIIMYPLVHKKSYVLDQDQINEATKRKLNNE